MRTQRSGQQIRPQIGAGQPYLTPATSIANQKATLSLAEGFMCEIALTREDQLNMSVPLPCSAAMGAGLFSINESSSKPKI